MGRELKKIDHSFLSEFLIFFAAATATIKIVRRPKKRERKKKTQLMWPSNLPLRSPVARLGYHGEQLSGPITL